MTNLESATGQLVHRSADTPANNNGIIEATDGPDAVVEVKVDELRCDLSPRGGGVDAKHVELLAQSDAALPPVLVHRETLSVIDGAHRVHAARLRGMTSIAAKFFDGSREDAFVLAVRANIAHGLPLKLADRKRAAVKIGQIYPEWSDRRIAEAAGLSHKTVGAIRQSPTGEIPQSDRSVGRDGRVRRASRKRTPRVPRGATPETSRDTSHGGAELSIIAHPATSSLTSEVCRSNPSQSSDCALPQPEIGEVATEGAAARIVRGLSSDPSLRFNNSGRMFLQWVTAGPRTPEAAVSLAASLPEHCVSSAFRIARRNAQMWNTFAVKLRDRVDPHEGGLDWASLANGEMSG